MPYAARNIDEQRDEVTPAVLPLKSVAHIPSTPFRLNLYLSFSFHDILEIPPLMLRGEPLRHYDDYRIILLIWRP